jgi:hypothetical protein
VFDLSDEAEELGLHLREGVEEVRQRLVVPLARRYRVNDLVGQVDVSLHQVHVPDQLVVLLRHRVQGAASTTTAARAAGRGALRLWLRLRTDGRERHAALLEGRVDVVKKRQHVAPGLELQPPLLDQVHHFLLDLCV